MPARLSTLLALVTVACCTCCGLSVGGVLKVLEDLEETTTGTCSSLCATGDYEEKNGGCRCAVGCKDPKMLFLGGIKVMNGVLWGHCDPDANKPFKRTLKEDIKCSYAKCCYDERPQPGVR